jgi:hypothetical protein
LHACTGCSLAQCNWDTYMVCTIAQLLPCKLRH